MSTEISTARRDWPFDTGLWLEVDTEQGLIEPNDRFNFMIPDESLGTTSEICGPDHLKFVKGPHKGQYVLDVLNRTCQSYDSRVNPNEWELDTFWNAMGFVVIPDVLKRYSPEDGYYHA